MVCPSNLYNVHANVPSLAMFIIEIRLVKKHTFFKSNKSNENIAHREKLNS